MSLHPDYPVVRGDYQFTDEWSAHLPEPFNRRIEDGQLVLWRPQLTFWIAVWGNDQGTPPETRLDSLLQRANPLRAEQQIERAGELIRLTYELPEHDDARAQQRYTSISGYVIAAAGHVQISAYFDSAQARSLAYQVMHSVAMTASTP